MPRHHEAEVIVVGGGPAGLSAAIHLARYGRNVALFDLGHGRSTYHQVNHNYLGFPGGISAVELRRRGLEQLAEYEHVRVEHHRVDRLEVAPGGFRAEGQFGDTEGLAAILCMGVLDHYPHFPGWEECVGVSMFWCVTCDGYESRGKRIVVAGHTNAAAGEALQLGRLSSDVTLISNSHLDEIEERFKRRLAAAGVPLIHSRLKQAIHDSGHLEALELENGARLPVEALFVVQGATPQTGLARLLGIELTESGYIVVDVEQQTSLQGVYAAGDVTSIHSHLVSAAVQEGAQAAAAANYYLYPPELKAE